MAEPTTLPELQKQLQGLRTLGIEAMQAEVVRAPPPQYFYHYSRMSTVEEILRSRCIWATEISFLNDTTELHHARNLMRAALAKQQPPLIVGQDYWLTKLKLLERIPHILAFITAFSTEDDRLSQWRAYADDGAGVAMGFDLAFASPPTVEGFGQAVVRPCIYSDSEENLIDCVVRPQVEAVRAYVARAGDGGDQQSRSMLLTSLLETITELGLTLKNPGFYEEHEWRLVASCSRHDVPDAVQFRNTPFGPAPFVRIPIEPARLKRLGLGPKVSPAAERSLALMLRRYGSDANIYRARVTYR